MDRQMDRVILYIFCMGCGGGGYYKHGDNTRHMNVIKTTPVTTGKINWKTRQTVSMQKGDKQCL